MTLFEWLANIEIIGFMVTALITYSLDKGLVRYGMATEEEVKDQKWVVFLLCIFWWIFLPALINSYIKSGHTK